MSRKDDDFRTILAFFWLTQDEEEDKPVDTSDCFPMILFTVVMIGGLSDNFYWENASVVVFPLNFRRIFEGLLNSWLSVFWAYYS